jgi:molybdopterin biosynthesis enzyme
MVCKEDIPTLLAIGKEHLYVWEASDEQTVHEDDAAGYLAEFTCGKDAGIDVSDVNQGKIELKANVHGIFQSDTDRLFQLNRIPYVSIAARRGNSSVRPGDLLATMRVIPLTVPKETISTVAAVAAVASENIFRIRPYCSKKIAVITTGNEVYTGKIVDGMLPALNRVLSPFDTETIGQTVLPDDPEQITSAILQFAKKGAEVIFVAGGMSVDPDDQTPRAIKDTGASIITYGMPVNPGSMYMLAYLDVEGREITILGVPGGILHSKRSAIDILLPRIFANIRLCKEDLVRMSNGGLCFSCVNCIFPDCGFGAS